jgi:hypothetical protein
VAAKTLDQASTLQGAGHVSHARSPNAQHLGKKFLSESNVVASGKIATTQQPSCEPRFDPVGAVAGCALLRLSEQEMLVHEQPVAKHGSLIDHTAHNQ